MYQVDIIESPDTFIGIATLGTEYHVYKEGKEVGVWAGLSKDEFEQRASKEYGDFEYQSPANSKEFHRQQVPSNQSSPR